MTHDGSKAGDILRYSFLRVFANDATIDQEELDFMQRLALEDGEVDEAERRVLARIFSRVTEDTVEPEVWADIAAFKKRHDIR